MAWAAAWESCNPDKVAALYARDATHASAVVKSALSGGAKLRCSKGATRFANTRAAQRRGSPHCALRLFRWSKPAIPAPRSNIFDIRISTLISQRTYWNSSNGIANG